MSQSHPRSRVHSDRFERNSSLIIQIHLFVVVHDPYFLYNGSSNLLFWYQNSKLLRG
jgi:hypothetical protein